MIVRTYGRRNRSITGSCSDEVVLGSQESSQDVYAFGFSPQDSPGHWSDMNLSSQESKELTNLPLLTGREDGEFDGSGEGYFRKSKKVKVGGGSHDSDGLGFNCSQESGEFGVFPWRKGMENENLRGSDGGYLWKSNVVMIDDDSDPYGFNSSQEQREFKNFDGRAGKMKKGKNGKIKENAVLMKKKKEKKKTEVSYACMLAPTATLMETQEFGEMMEHVDEVNFALDGLKRGHPLRIRRASLFSLLSICGTAQQRRLLRAHGFAKMIIDSVLGLSLDDSPSNLAAATLFYILTSDGQDDRLLDSPSYIRFLIKLLKPLASDAAKVMRPTIGNKLLALCMDANGSQDFGKGLDSTSAVMQKVQEILVNCKEIKLVEEDDYGIEKPELSPKWISLLIMEKACISTLPIEDTSGVVRKTGGNFKEKLRELGGLDAVFEVTRSCHDTMEGWSEQSLSSVIQSKDKAGLESLVLLLKCLKIMENATFLSKDNQSHLLEMKGIYGSQHAPRSFVKLILSLIKILSDVSLQSVKDEKSRNQTSGSIYASKMLLTYNIDDINEILSTTSSEKCCTLENNQRLTSGKPGSQINQRLTSCQLRSSRPCSEKAITSTSDSCFSKVRLNSSMSGSCIGDSMNSKNGTSLSENSSNMKLEGSNNNRHSDMENSRFDNAEDFQDPFAFDEDDFEPSKWDLLSGRKKASQSQNSRATIHECENGYLPPYTLGEEESSSTLASSSSLVDEKAFNLVGECLLTAVKVLMNLTNDNPLGCEQIAAGGGLEMLSALIADHFPSFISTLPPFIMSKEDSGFSKSIIEANHQKDRHLTDQELDLLVAILGLLVNLVEKDSRNRSRLAASSISLPGLKGLNEESHGDVITLLCSIFLANQGAGEVAGEGRYLSWDDEDAISQEEKEAEKMIIEAYAALLLAFLSTESKSIRNAIAECLPDHNLAILIPVLERFVEFHLSLNMISEETHTAVLEVIESCRIP